MGPVTIVGSPGVISTSLPLPQVAGTVSGMSRAWSPGFRVVAAATPMVI
jgi:hypothetical protein